MPFHAWGQLFSVLRLNHRVLKMSFIRVLTVGAILLLNITCGFGSPYLLLGAGVGVFHSQHDSQTHMRLSDITHDSLSIDFSNNIQAHSSSYDGEIGVGLGGFFANNWYAALEVIDSYGEENALFDGVSYVSPSSLNNSITYHDKISIDSSLGVSGLLGYRFGHVLPYFSLGYVIASINLQQNIALYGADDSLTQVFLLHQHKAIGAWVLGLGSRFRIAKHWRLGLAYELSLYPTATFDLESGDLPYGPEPSWQINVDSKVRLHDLTSSKALIQLIYNF